MLDLSFSARGDIPGKVKKEISEIVTDCYKKFGDRVPYKVEVCAFDTEERMNNFLKEESFKLSLPYHPSDDSSPCAYDVLRGFPRLLIPIDRLSNYSKQGRAGAIRHEAAHTVLHGSLEFNIFQIPDDCRHVASIKGIEPDKLEGIFLQLTLAIKDHEATHFLVEHGFIHCQFAYALDWIKPGEGDRAAWMIAKANRQARFIYESALMRPLLFVNPLLSLPRTKVPEEAKLQLGARVEKMIDMLGESEENKVLQVAAAIIEVLSRTAQNNIDAAFHQLMSLI